MAQNANLTDILVSLMVRIIKKGDATTNTVPAYLFTVGFTNILPFVVQPICWNREPTSGIFRNFWVTKAARPPKSTSMSVKKGCRT